jgi:hypothetical protein
MLILGIATYVHNYNMVMGIAPPIMEDGDYDNNQSIIEMSGKTERFYFKFYDIWNECNTTDNDRFEAIYEMCVTLFIDFNRRMDGYFTNHTEEVETVLYR